MVQPVFLPWRGYFHQIQKADTFIFYDDVQYVRYRWYNRNRVKTPQGPVWLTVPVHVHLGSAIDAVTIDWSRDWSSRHLKTLWCAYRRAPCFDETWPLVESIFGRRDTLLADLTVASTIEIAKALGLAERRFLRSSQFPPRAGAALTDRAIEVLLAVGTTHFLAGPTARAYLEPDKFEAAGITLEFISYDYSEYPQLHPPFDPHVSVIDLLFMEGAAAGEQIWGSA